MTEPKTVLLMSPLLFIFVNVNVVVFSVPTGRKGRKGGSDSEDEPRPVYEVLKTVEGEMPDVSL